MVTVKQLQNPLNGPLNPEQYISNKNRLKAIKQAANILKKHLLAEVENTNISTERKRRIEENILTELNPSGAISVRINTPEAAEIEFGTTDQDEQPFIMRASINAKAELKTVLKNQLK